MPANPIQPSSGPFLLPVHLRLEQGTVNSQMRHYSGTDDPSGKVQKLLPTAEGDSVVTTPPQFPLLMKGIKQGLKVAHIFGLNAGVGHLHRGHIMYPNLVILSMYDLMCMPRNPDRLIRNHLNWVI